MRIFGGKLPPHRSFSPFAAGAAAREWIFAAGGIKSKGRHFVSVTLHTFGGLWLWCIARDDLWRLIGDSRAWGNSRMLSYEFLISRILDTFGSSQIKFNLTKVLVFFGVESHWFIYSRVAIIFTRSNLITVFFSKKERFWEGCTRYKMIQFNLI